MADHERVVAFWVRLRRHDFKSVPVMCKRVQSSSAISDRETLNSEYVSELQMDNDRPQNTIHTQQPIEDAIPHPEAF